MNAFLSPLIKELLWLHMSTMDSFQQKSKKKSIGLSPNSTSTINLNLTSNTNASLTKKPKNIWHHEGYTLESRKISVRRFDLEIPQAGCRARLPKVRRNRLMRFCLVPGHEHTEEQ